MTSNYRITKENWEKVTKLDMEIARLEKERELYISAWKAQLEEEGKTEKTIGNGLATVGWNISYQNRFNQSKFGKEHADLLEQYKERKEIKSFKY